jgi:hypothetical protein
MNLFLENQPVKQEVCLKISECLWHTVVWKGARADRIIGLDTTSPSAKQIFVKTHPMMLTIKSSRSLRDATQCTQVEVTQPFGETSCPHYLGLLFFCFLARLTSRLWMWRHHVCPKSRETTRRHIPEDTIFGNCWKIYRTSIFATEKKILFLIVSYFETLEIYRAIVRHFSKVFLKTISSSTVRHSTGVCMQV